MDQHNKSTPSSSSSSLLLNSANLAWTPSGGMLVQPQPPIEMPVRSTRSTPTLEATLSSLIKPTSTGSLNNLDNFQSINLNANSHHNPNNITVGLEQVSLTSTSTQPTQTGQHSFYNYSSQDNLNQQESGSNLKPNQSEYQPQVTAPNFYPTQVTSSGYQFYLNNALSTAQSQGSNESKPLYETPTTHLGYEQQHPVQAQGPPQGPPKGSSFNFRRQGPLRLYDPNHGMETSQQNSSSNSNQETPSTQFQVPTYSPDKTAIFYPQQFAGDCPGESSFVTSPQETVQQPQQSNYNNLYPQGSNENVQQTNHEQPIQAQVDYSYNYSNYYIPVQPHWFFQKFIENREIWMPFSMLDSVNLEQAWVEHYSEPNFIVATNGGRYDVYVNERFRKAVYWDEKPASVRRCTWFYKKEGDTHSFPYAEDFAAQLEELYKQAFINNNWNQQVTFPDQEVIVMYNPQSIYHYKNELNQPDEWGSMAENPIRPRPVQRGALEFDIEEGEPVQVDHLVFLVHGIGEICDLRFRSIVEVVDDFRNIHLSLLKTHFKQHLDTGTIGRIELLPVSWHSALHGDETGIDSRLKLITLNSIPKLRYFTNDTILDALFYTSPLYCQTIVSTVSSEIDRLFELFKQRNPSFNGTVALGGHSLGSVIIFDILAHQNNEEIQDSNDKCFDSNDECFDSNKFNDINDVESLCSFYGLDEYLAKFQEEKIDFESFLLMNEDDFKNLGIPLGPTKKLLVIKKKILSKGKQLSNDDNIDSQRKESIAVNYSAAGSHGTGYPSIDYPKLNFNPSCFFAMGSPIAMFLTVRGIETVSSDYRLPTCNRMFNIFHPFDPIAYRIEPMIDPSYRTIKPLLIPHHKGRKRMHLQIKESIIDLRQRVVDSIRSTWNSIQDFALAHKPIEPPKDVEDEVKRMVDEELQLTEGEEEPRGKIKPIGSLNGGKRIDYVLQERPFEIVNEYLFAMASHACYWESEDTALMMLKELYFNQGILPLAYSELSTVEY